MNLRSRTYFFVLTVLAILGFSAQSRAQSALLMEEPYGFFGTLNPTGHTAIYFSRICAETPVKLRRCEPGELGSVIARYQGIAGYDWVAMPLIPYLYSVESASEVRERVNKDDVLRLRRLYHETHLGALGADVFEGNIVHGGWNQLIGVAYERRIFAYRFATTEAQDEALMDLLNDRTNKSEFNLIYNNCADFARGVMNYYYPHVFTRTFFPDAGMTTPRQITFRLAKYSKKHPEAELAVFEIPQVPGYRRKSGTNKSVSASLITTGYAIPIAIFNPYLAGGLLADYLIRGRFAHLPKDPHVLHPDELVELTGAPAAPENALSAGVQAGAAVPAVLPAVQPTPATTMLTRGATTGLKANTDVHE